jgi:PAS domain-containing protein
VQKSDFERSGIMTGATHSIIQSHDVSTLQRIIDEIPCAIFILNTNGIIIECSKTALSLFHMDKIGFDNRKKSRNHISSISAKWEKKHR